MMRQVETVKISADVIAKLEKLKDAGKTPLKLTEEQEAIILEYYNKKDKIELAKFIGISENSLRRHYKRLASDVTGRK